MKATAVAPASIAFIKYWGKKNEVLRLPQNGSISMNLDSVLTTTSVEFKDEYAQDEIILNGKRIASGERVIKQLNLVRKLAGADIKAKVVTDNNFPTAAGIASSASGFAALTMAAAAALNLDLPEKELSILARQGSGSACRSIPSGFVEWIAGAASDSSYAVSLYPPDYWDICDVIAIVNDEEKEISSSVGQKLASTSPFFSARLANIGNKIKTVKGYLADRNFKSFGELIEAEALELMAIMMTSAPALIYWRPETVKLIKKIMEWRRLGLDVYFTEDAGPNLHIIIEGRNLESLSGELRGIKEVKRVIVNKPGRGAALTNRHLF